MGKKPSGKLPGKAKARTGRTLARRSYGALGGTKPRVFRASEDVSALLDERVIETGRTQSAIIDEGLRRVFWTEEQYTNALARNFGGSALLALAFLIARIIAGIEHRMKARMADSSEVSQQAAHAVSQLIGSLATGGPGGSSSKQVGAANATARFKLQGSFRRATICSAAEDLDVSWLLVMREIDSNLEHGGDLWWPLADAADISLRGIAPLPPLRPSIADLRAVWSWVDPEAQHQKGKR